MAVLLFTVLNGLGVVFLLYVLMQFWKEERHASRPAETETLGKLPAKVRPTVLVVTRPLSIRTRRGLSVVSRQASGQPSPAQKSDDTQVGWRYKIERASK